MDRIIEIKVNGSHLTKDSRIAGVQHEGNAKALRIEFDPGWDGYAKKVTFWDATGENPVERTLTADLLEDLTKSIRIYLCKIPPEPMVEAGEFTFVIDGYTDGVRQRSIADTLVVKAAPFIEQADEPTDPTPSQAEHLQKQIDTLLEDIQKEALRVETEADRAEDAREGAEAARQAAGTAADRAEEATAGVGEALQAAETAADRAEDAQEAIENMAVTSETLDSSSEASVKKIVQNGTVRLHFGIPHGSPGEGQSDWDESNPDATSYVKHRTHWKEYIQKAATLLAETNVKFPNELSSVGSVGTGNLTAGLICKVKWNGTVYTCTAFSSGGSVMLGNAALNSIGDDTGEPFLLEAFAAATSYLTKSTSAAETVSVHIWTEEIVIWHKLDREFIPELDYAKDMPKNVSELNNDVGYITASEAPKKTSELTNDSGFITSKAVPTKVSQLNNDAGFITDSAVPKRTSQLTNDSGFATTGAIPTRTSQLTNDSGYITASSVPTRTSQLTNDSGFITEIKLGAGLKFDSNGAITLDVASAEEVGF